MSSDQGRIPIDHWLVGANVATIVTNNTNQKMLNKILLDAGCVPTLFDPNNFNVSLPDLLIIDSIVLSNISPLIQKLRMMAAPALFPVLLLSDKSRLPSNEPGFYSDDVVRLPTTRAELLARIRNLLHLSDVSRRQALEVSASEIFLNSSKTEEELISSFCELMDRMRGVSAITGGIFVPSTSDGLRNNPIYNSNLRVLRNFRDHDQHDNSFLEWEQNIVLSTRNVEEQQIFTPENTNQFWCRSLESSAIRSVISCPIKPNSGASGLLIFYLTINVSKDDYVFIFLDRINRQLAASVDKLRLAIESQVQSRQIDALANTDPLTNLPNRRALSKFLANLVAENKNPSAAVLFIDLNNFKLINDSLGHHIGDMLLQQVAERLKKTIRENDMLARQGGDEFIIIMHHSRRKFGSERLNHLRELANDAELLALRITEIFALPFQLEAQSHRINASIGISLLCAPIDDPEVIIDQADMAMYHAKETDQRITFYTAEIEEIRRRRLIIEADVYNALELEQFRLHYQPIWSLSRAHIVGVEALLRWTDSTGRNVPPSDFIPIVESLKLMHKLSDMVITTAARQLREWREKGIELKMSINLSVTQLQTVADVDRIYRLIKEEHTPAEWWVLEITEEMIAKNSKKVEAALHLLKQKGFTLALDDFGCGYSSLSRLQDLPIDILKIEKSFISRMSRGNKQVAFVKAIIEMARALSMQVTAEGIETSFHYDTLRDLNCDYGQGFLLAAPASADALHELLLEERKVSSG